MRLQRRVLCCWRQACEHCCSFVLCDMALCGCQRKMEEEIAARRRQEEKDRQLAVLWSDSHAPHRSSSLHSPVPSRLYFPGQMVPSICVQAHASRRHVYAHKNAQHTHTHTCRPIDWLADSFTSSLIPTHAFGAAHTTSSSSRDGSCMHDVARCAPGTAFVVCRGMQGSCLLNTRARAGVDRNDARPRTPQARMQHEPCTATSHVSTC
jgi:hypothetical protein